MIHLILKEARKELNQYRDWKHSKNYGKLWINKIDKNITLPVLTQREKTEINEMWGKVLHNKEIAYKELSLYKFYNGFDPEYCASGILNPYIIRKLNSIQKQCLADKGLIPFIFNGIKQPRLIIRNEVGSYFDKNNELITIEDSVRLILKDEKDLIIKPSIDTRNGQNVKKITNKSKQSTANIRKMLIEYKENFVVQECLSQSIATSVFNKSSLNTIRVVTMLLNSKFSICSLYIKFGGEGSITNSFLSNDEGMAVGIDANTGKLMNGYGHSMLQYKAKGDIDFDKHYIPNIKSIINMAKEAHYRIPMMPIVGWDIALDADNSPVLIEGNINCPGVVSAQLCYGPFFKDRTKEVLEYTHYK